MTEKPDAGRIVDRERVPILPNDLAREVFDKVTVAAEIVLERSLPSLLAGTARLDQQDLAAGSYHGRRRPADGAIDPDWPARRIHDLVRAVAPPYPGAFCLVEGRRLKVLRTFDSGERAAPASRAALLARGTILQLRGADGGLLLVLQAEMDGLPFNADRMRELFGMDSLTLQKVSANT
jgi:methionyl-tRNA formyltransferase